MKRTALLLAVVLAACAGVQAQGNGPAEGKVEDAIRKGKHDVALSLLAKLLKKSPKDTTLLRARMSVLMAMQSNAEALVCAQQLLKALPAGLERTALQTLEALLERKAEVLKGGEFQEVLEKAELYCGARNAMRLLEILTKLKKLLPDDPVLHLGLGEIYSSTGSFNRTKATAAFRKFLALTTNAKLKNGVPPDESMLAEPLRELATLQQGNDLRATRLAVHSTLDLLKEGYRLLLMTDPAWIEEWKSKAERSRDARHNLIQEAEDELARCRRAPAKADRFRRRTRAATIQFYKQVIKREKKNLAGAIEELELLEKGLRKGKSS